MSDAKEEIKQPINEIVQCNQPFDGTVILRGSLSSLDKVNNKIINCLAKSLTKYNLISSHMRFMN
jgi:hypothetical protein